MTYYARPSQYLKAFVDVLTRFPGHETRFGTYGAKWGLLGAVIELQDVYVALIEPEEPAGNSAPIEISKATYDFDVLKLLKHQIHVRQLVIERASIPLIRKDRGIDFLKLLKARQNLIFDAGPHPLNVNAGLWKAGMAAGDGIMTWVRTLEVLVPSMVIADGVIKFKDAVSKRPIREIPFSELKIISAKNPNEIGIHGQFIPGYFSHEIPLTFQGSYDITGNSLSFHIMDSVGRFVNTGKFFSLSHPIPWQMNLEFHQLPIETVRYEKVGLPVWLRNTTGALTAYIEMQGEGVSAEEMGRTSIAQGPFDVRNGSFSGINLVRAIMSGIDPQMILQDNGLPAWNLGLEAARDGGESNAKEKRFHKLFAADSTMFQIHKAQLQYIDRRISLKDGQISSPDYFIQYEGTVDTRDGFVDIRGVLILYRDLAEILFHRQKEDGLPVSRADDGRMVAPFRLRGVLPNPSFSGDQIR